MATPVCRSAEIKQKMMRRIGALRAFYIEFEGGLCYAYTRTKADKTYILFRIVRGDMLEYGQCWEIVNGIGVEVCAKGTMLHFGQFQWDMQSEAAAAAAVDVLITAFDGVD